VRQQNGVFVALDGEGAGNLHRYARLLYAQEGADFLAVGSALEGLGDVDWQRHTVRKRGAWTLVVDRIAVRRRGEAIVERHWHVEGQVAEAPRGLVSRMERNGDPLCLHLQSAGIPEEGTSGTDDRKEILRIRAEPDDRVEIATLLYVDSEPDTERYTCARTEAGWRVDTAEGGAEVVVADDGATVGQATGVSHETPSDKLLPLLPEAPAAPLDWISAAIGGPVTALAERDGWIAAGSEEGEVAVLEPGLNTRWRGRVESPVLSLHFFEDGLLVGEDNGTISRLDALGKQIWHVQIPYVPLSWPHWSDRRSRIREITSADVDGDGTQEIVLSNGDRRVYAFDASGNQLWKTPIRWGNYLAMTPVDYQGAFALFGGATWPTLRGECIIFGGDGEERGRLKRFSIESQHVRDLRLSDLDGDGADEIVCALDVNCRQLFVTDNQGEPIWDADVAGAAATVEIREYEGRRQVLCASDGGSLAAFDGTSGERMWVCTIGDRARALWPLPDGRVVAVCPSGRTFVLDGQGQLIGRAAFPGPVTGLLRPGEHRAQATSFPVGTADGQVYLLKEE
jgi:outer membrane protein assembly factor BamB